MSSAIAVQSVRKATGLIRLATMKRVVGALFLKQVEGIERTLVRSLERFFMSQLRDMSERIRALGDIPIGGDPLSAGEAERLAAEYIDFIYNPREWDEELVNATFPHLAAASFRAAAAQLTLMGVRLPAEKRTTATEWLEGHPEDLDELRELLEQEDLPFIPLTTIPLVTREAIVKNLKESFKQPYWKKINDTTKGDAERALMKGLQEGHSSRRIANNFASRFLTIGSKKYANARAMNITRTESGNALNGAKVAAVDGLKDEVGGELPVQQIWLSVLADTTRDEHALLDGTPEDNEGLWNLAGFMVPWPSHYTLPAGQRCNCMCTTIVDFMDEDTVNSEIDAYNERVEEHE